MRTVASPQRQQSAQFDVARVMSGLYGTASLATRALLAASGFTRFARILSAILHRPCSALAVQSAGARNATTQSPP